MAINYGDHYHKNQGLTGNELNIPFIILPPHLYGIIGEEIKYFNPKYDGDEKLINTDHEVYCAMLQFAFVDKEKGIRKPCWTSADRLSYWLNCSPGTIRNSWTRLRDAGLIIKSIYRSRNKRTGEKKYFKTDAEAKQFQREDGQGWERLTTIHFMLEPLKVKPRKKIELKADNMTDFDDFSFLEDGEGTNVQDGEHDYVDDDDVVELEGGDEGIVHPTTKPKKKVSLIKRPPLNSSSIMP